MEDHEVPLLEEAIGKLWDKAREFGLDPFPVHFQMVPAHIMYEFGAYLLPGRFQHWSHGKAFYVMKTHYDYGLSKIYELVINANPSYAFLLETNTLLANKFVVAHVFGHSDFFKHNVWFRGTDREMPETVVGHARRIRQYSQDEGMAEVERFLDAAMALAHHIDPFDRPPAPAADHAGAPGETPRLTGGSWSDLFPPERASVWNHGRQRQARRRVPPEPEQDLLRFLIDYADHLEDWQRDILSIIRRETLYFVPQMMTKIMNEGWASFWHNRILRAADLSDAEFTEFARLHAAVCTAGGTRLNPYYVGLRIWEDIEQRYGQERMFEVRELDSDASFIRLYLTEEICRELDLFVYALDDDEWRVTTTDWEEVRDTIVDSFTNFGNPLITVDDGDYRGRRELYLRHHYDGRDLDVPYAERTLQHLYDLWLRPVHLETVLQGHVMVLSYTADGLRREEV